ncbi:Lrp/AsnC family transcriptional regulator [Candidatus Woesearchaeota archaeon]|nr:Lrp/AsnC family transcriptional regulator [Candidatus Woesearchaeota archaeon]
MNKKDLVILSHLRQNGRMSLSELSRKSRMPVSTIWERMKWQCAQDIARHSCIVDFTKLGFQARASVLLAVNRKDRDRLREHLSKHLNVNGLYRITNGYDFLVECVFRNLKEMDCFVQNLEDKHDIVDKKVHIVVDDVKREGFLADPELVECVASG